MGGAKYIRNVLNAQSVGVTYGGEAGGAMARATAQLAISCLLSFLSCSTSETYLSTHKL